LFGYPERVEQKDQVDTEDENSQTMVKLETTRKRPDSILDISRANKQFERGQEQADKIIAETYKAILEDFNEQLTTNFDTYADNLRIRTRHREELANKLNELYLGLFEDGQKAARTELYKLGLNQQKLSLSGKEKRSIKNNILRLVNKFMITIKTGVETALNKTNVTKIADKGGMKSFLDQFVDGFKGMKRDLRVEVQTGYTTGRADTLTEFQDDVELFLYDSTLDKNLCEKCRPFDGEIFTQKEWESKGFNEKSPVNPDCLGLLGNNDCRCQKVPYKLK
jgi:hypothetical protein